MAAAHIHFNHENNHGGLLHGALVRLEEAFAELNEIHGTMLMMIDGDGTQAAHFAYMTTRFGFADDAGSKAAFDELSSLLFKLNTNTSVSDVNAALKQAFNKFR